MTDWKSEAVKLAEEGMSWRGIARELGVPRSTVSDNLRSYFKEKERYGEDGPKILLLDIETSPLLSMHWGLFKQNIAINQIVTDWEIMMVGYKWLGDKASNIITAREHWTQGRGDSLEELVLNAWALLNEADILVCHNVKFDDKKLKAKFSEYGLPPPAPYKKVCTLQIAKSQFGHSSNKLDYLAKKLTDEGKIETGGMQLWIDCLAGKEEAWNHMEDYCKRDVDVLEGLYLELRPWDNRHPNLQLYYDDEEERCGRCGSLEVEDLVDKVAHTNVSTFNLVKCNECGTIRRGRKNVVNKEKMKSVTMNVS